MHMTGIEPAARPQHQRAARRRAARSGVRQRHAGRVDRARRAALSCTPASTSTCRRGGRSCSPTTRSSISRTTPTAPFSLPADSYDLAAEWGPAAGIPRHIASAMINTAAADELPARRDDLGASRARRYNITTGRDDNGDTVFNDRPAGVGRNSAARRGLVGRRRAPELRVRLRRAPPPTARAARPTMIMHRVGGGERRRPARRPDAAAAPRTSGSASSCSRRRRTCSTASPRSATPA